MKWEEHRAKVVCNKIYLLVLFVNYHMFMSVVRLLGCRLAAGQSFSDTDHTLMGFH